MTAHKLPYFYEANMSELPPAVAIGPEALVLWLREDNRRGAVVQGPHGLVAVWTANEDGANDDYYTQDLPLEDPGDADWHGTARTAVKATLRVAV